MTLMQAKNLLVRNKEESERPGWQRRLIHIFCKRIDIEPYLLTQELDAVRERREQRDKARLHHAEARVIMSEKKEWLRFLKRNAKNEEEFRDYMENESIDVYKKMILGQALSSKEAQWGEFAGEDLNEAYQNPVFAQRYKLSNVIHTIDELEKQVRSEFKIIK